MAGMRMFINQKGTHSTPYIGRSVADTRMFINQQGAHSTPYSWVSFSFKSNSLIVSYA